MNLYKVVSDAIDDNGDFTPVSDTIVAAIVAYLTNEEAVIRALDAQSKVYSDDWRLKPKAEQAWCREGVRAGLFAALGAKA